MEYETALLTYAAALFTMMNPIGNVGVFAGMTASMSAADARKTVWRSATAIAIILLLATWAGSALLKFFGIGVHELRAAGGLIVLRVALKMVSGNSESSSKSSDRKSIAIVPIAIPLVAGPGSIATVIVASERHSGIMAHIDLSFVAVGMALVTALAFSFARKISGFLGEEGMNVVTKIMGMILAAIAVGMIAHGLMGLFPALKIGGN